MMKSLLVVLFAIGCGGGQEPVGNQTDAPAPPGDSPGNSAGLPSWQIEDVQPQSPRVGEVYGLDSFNGKIVVVTLLEGF